MKNRLSARLIEAARAAGCEGPIDVARRTPNEILSWPRVGRRGLAEIETWLESHGLTLAETQDEWSYGHLVPDPAADLESSEVDEGDLDD